VTTGDVSLQEVLADIWRQAESAGAGGTLGEDYEAELDACFDAVAEDLVSLTKGVESGELTARQQFSFGSGLGTGSAGAASRSERGARAARALTHRGLAKARRLAGPKLRAVERLSIDRAGQAAEAIATRGYVLGDRARRMTSAGPVSQRIARVSPSERARPDGGESARGRDASFGGGSWRLEDWAFERLKQAPGAPVLHVECGDGNFVRRLAANGYSASGADPFGAVESASIRRAGALEALGRTSRSSLGGLILSGVTDRVNAARARSLVHLAASHLRPGAVVIIVSADPERESDGDVIASDLSERRSLHPVTWCHLLGRYGFGLITVEDGDQPAGYYGVSAVRQ
jgi:hypothetical protein